MKFVGYFEKASTYRKETKKDGSLPEVDKHWRIQLLAPVGDTVNANEFHDLADGPIVVSIEGQQIRLPLKTESKPPVERQKPA